MGVVGAHHNDSTKSFSTSSLDSRDSRSNSGSFNDHDMDDATGNVKVIIRIRPLSPAEVQAPDDKRCVRQESDRKLTWLGPPETSFSFDHVAAEDVTQEQLFSHVGAPMVENCIAGYKCCLFAYGQTGSGKTYTILGNLEGPGQGLTPRVIEHLFARAQDDECGSFSVKCSFMEIYNEHVADLLEPSSTNLAVREDPRRGVCVENLTRVDVFSVEDAVEVLGKGMANRKVAVTNINEESSRSHSIFTCCVRRKNGSKTLSGLLHLVDLAGSERQKQTGAEGGRLKEGANINKSLSTLGLVIKNLVQKKSYVPYRNSKLTFILQDSLGGNAKTAIIANIGPSGRFASETLSTLRFAQRAKFMRSAAAVNEETTEDDVGALRAEIEQLKRQLLRTRSNLARGLNSSSFSLTKTSRGSKTLSGNTLNVACAEGRESAKKIKTLEGILAGALRREIEAERVSENLAAQIEHLHELAVKREQETLNTRMLLRFRDEKIKRLENAAAGCMSVDALLYAENKALKEEINLLHERIERDPELTRFATENLMLREQIEKYHDFYEGGEREIMMEEISDLRDKLSELLDWKQQLEQKSGNDDLKQYNIDNKSSVNFNIS